ncbi:MarR family winged helix-turn-helix transcriptional regulator [Lysinibacillus xylanilyticus]|uniref:MarR family winged helix-turn-helix transcriptional regulator n=1 Tax=Lysinibacillus xylanilyticus TaxID=582475 RepID=UPI00382C9625
MIQNECMNFFLSVSQHKVFKYFSKVLEEFDVTPAQYGVLNCLWQEGQITPKRIGELLYLEASTVSGILDKMQKLNLIEREIDPNNRRVVLVTCTEKGENLRPKIEVATGKMNEVVLGNLSIPDQKILKEALQTIINTDFS